MIVTLIARTEYLADAAAEVMKDFRTDTDGGSALAEAAGRACYRSFSKPNPATATNAGYLRHILETGHLSVLEHASATFFIRGVSRSLTHELVRHRHFSYSQESQRYVPGAGVLVMPPEAVGDVTATEIIEEAAEEAEIAYNRLVDHFDMKLRADEGLSKTMRHKRARQAARAVLPNATATAIVVTGNYRALRHFIDLRATEHADTEIRALAVEILRQLRSEASAVFADYEITTLADGTEVATSPYVVTG